MSRASIAARRATVFAAAFLAAVGTGLASGVSGCRECPVMDAEAEGQCETVLGWSVYECGCFRLVGCRCIGEDCPDVFESSNDCDEAVKGATCRCR